MFSIIQNLDPSVQKTSQVGRARADEQSRRGRTDGPGLAGQGGKRNDSKALVKQYNHMIAKKSDRLFSTTDQVTSAR